MARRTAAPLLPLLLALALAGGSTPEAEEHHRPKRLLRYAPAARHVTPFVESNALPGGFRPLPLPPPALYDHLARIKLAGRPPPRTVYAEAFAATTAQPAPPPRTVYVLVRAPAPLPPPPPPPSADNALAEVLRRLQASDALPATLTPANVDSSIRTLVRILEALRRRRPPPKKPAAATTAAPDEDDPEGGTPGRPGVDYPTLRRIPPTAFSCRDQRYKGFFGDPATGCQVWHYCDLNGGQASFLCPNGTVFSQVALTCDWWYNVRCGAATAQQYVLNERLYKYILPLSPKFPEDYSGPLVDRYLTAKFREAEERLERARKGKGKGEGGAGGGGGGADGDGDGEEEDDGDPTEPPPPEADAPGDGTPPP